MSAFGLTTVPATGPSGSNGGAGNGDKNSGHAKRQSGKPRNASGRFAPNKQGTGGQGHQKTQRVNSGRQSNRKAVNKVGNASQQQVNSGQYQANLSHQQVNSGQSLAQNQAQSLAPLAIDPDYIIQTKSVPSTIKTLPKPTPQQDSLLGTVFSNPESLGFTPIPFKQTPLPNYLIQEPKFLHKHEFLPDPWDLQNQNKMLLMEKEVPDTNQLMELLEEMRKVERTEMENRGLVDKANVSKSLADAIVFRGSCLFMCPVFEKIKRKFNGDMSKYEQLGAIKTFSRSELGQLPQLPSDVRPPHVLVQTLDFIVDHLLDKLPDSELFIWNRTRSIRQDFTYQNYFGPETVYCIEKICRIHILTLHVMANSQVEYSQQQEVEQLNKSLETLNEIYDDLRLIGADSSPNEAEFRSYYLISYYNKPELDQMIQNLPRHLLQHRNIQSLIMFRGLLLQNNTSDKSDNLPGLFNLFVQFFHAVFDAETPFMMLCLLETHFNEVRFYALKSMSTAYHSGGKPYYAEQLLAMLGFDVVDELVAFIEYYDLKVSSENGQLVVHLTPFKYNYVKDKEKLKQSYSGRLTLKMGGRSYKEVVSEGITVGGVQRGTGVAGIVDVNANVDVNAAGKLTNSVPPQFNFTKIPIQRTETAQNVPPVQKQSQTHGQKPQAQALTLRLASFASSQALFAPCLPKPNLPPPKISEIKPESPKPAPTPAPKPAPKPKFSNSPSYQPAVNSIYTDILSKVVLGQIAGFLPSKIQLETASRSRNQLVDLLTSELYSLFMREMVHKAIMESKAEQLRRKNLSLLLVKTVIPIARASLSKLQRKKERILEFDDFTNNAAITARKRSSSPAMSNEIRKKIKVRSVSATKESSKALDLKRLWQPVDLSKTFVNALDLSAVGKDNNLSLNFLFVVQDWNELSARWLITKFGLLPNRLKTTFARKIVKPLGETNGRVSGKLKLRFTGLPDNLNEFEYFKKLGFVLLEFGSVKSGNDQTALRKKLKVDSKVLYKIVEMVSKNCIYDNVQVLILYYDSTNSKLDANEVSSLLKLDRLAQRFGPDLVSRVRIYDMTTTAVADRLDQCLKDFAAGYRYHLRASPEPEVIPEQDSNATTTGMEAPPSKTTLKRIEFLKSSLQRPRQIKLRSSSAASSAGSSFNSVDTSRMTSRSPSFVATTAAATPIAYSRFNNRLYDVGEDTTISGSRPRVGSFSNRWATAQRANNNSLLTSTPLHNHTISTPAGSNASNARDTKLSELQRLTASILKKKANN